MVSCSKLQLAVSKHDRSQTLQQVFFGFLIQTPAEISLFTKLRTCYVGKFCLDTDNWMSKQMRDPNTNWWFPIGMQGLPVDFSGSILKRTPMDAHKHLTNIAALAQHEASTEIINPMLNSSLSLWAMAFGVTQHLK